MICAQSVSSLPSCIQWRSLLRGLLGALLVLIVRTAGSQELPVLTLREIGSTPLPGSVDVTAAVIVGDTAVALVSRSQRAASVHSMPGGRWGKVLCYREWTAPLAVVELNGVVTALDSSGFLRSQRAELFRSSECQSRRAGLDSGLVIYSAVAVRTGWVLLVRSVDATDWIVRLDTAGNERARWRLTGAARTDVSPARSFLSAAGDSVIISSGDWPFQWTVVGSNGLDTGPHSIMDAPDRQIRDAPDRQIRALVTESWTGLRTVALDDGYLQVIAERSTERRAFVLYDRSRVARRVMMVDAIVGILDADAAAKKLLMLRRTDRLELVLYEWEWGSASPSP